MAHKSTPKMQRREGLQTKSAEDRDCVIDPAYGGGGLKCILIDRNGGMRAEAVCVQERKLVEQVLLVLVKMLKEEGCTFSALKGIGVRKGGESFSMVRGAYAIANALAWSLTIPTMAISAWEREEDAQRAVRVFNKKRQFHLLIPEYRREPNITLPKKA